MTFPVSLNRPITNESSSISLGVLWLEIACPKIEYIGEDNFVTNVNFIDEMNVFILLAKIAKSQKRKKE